MRVTGGLYKNRKLVAPKGNQVRPTSDRMRQSLFNMIHHAKWAQDFSLNGARCLDLFCGSGSLGIEALSNGAAHCTFVDIDTGSIRENATILPGGDYTIIRAPANRFTPPPRLSQKQNKTPTPPTASSPSPPLSSSPSLYDLVFMDPPYHKGLVMPTLHHLIDTGCLSDGAIIIIETENKLSLNLPSGVSPLDQRQQGISTLHILRYNAAVNQPQ